MLWGGGRFRAKDIRTPTPYPPPMSHNLVVGGGARMTVLTPKFVILKGIISFVDKDEDRFTDSRR